MYFARSTDPLCVASNQRADLCRVFPEHDISELENGQRARLRLPSPIQFKGGIFVVYDLRRYASIASFN